MAELFAATPHDVRRTGDELYEVSSRLKQVMASLWAQITGEFDGIACALEHGDADSFHTQCDHVHKTVDPGDTSVLDSLADWLKHAADVFQKSDEGLADWVLHRSDTGSGKSGPKDDGPKDDGGVMITIKETTQSHPAGG